MRYEYTPFEVKTPPELTKGADTPAAYPVAIVGAGPVGLAMAIDLALRGISVVVLDDNNVVSVGSRAICWAKRTLEIFDRLGVGERMVEKGITWKVGRLFHGEEEVYSFDLLPEDGHKMPAFINLQQYYVEQYLVERAQEFPDLIDLRFKNKVTAVSQTGEHASVEVETPEGTYTLNAQYLIACDGANSPVRNMMGLDFEGKLFEERFLIADVEMKADFPSERWFWFEPTFHPGQSALLHKQPDNIYRIDLQLGWDADPEEEKKPENVIPRIKKAVGDREFELDWVSVYTFQCRRIKRFVHDRILFVGDSAHVVSPFGARGGNGGIQDVDNVGWKLAAVLKGEAAPALLETYNQERTHGSDENIINSSRATNFMTPKNETQRIFRDEVLGLAHDMPFARKLINSGRLSMPCSLAGFDLETPGDEGIVKPGTAMPDAPLIGEKGPTWLLNIVGGEFTLLSFGKKPELGINDLKHVHITDNAPNDQAQIFADLTGDAFVRYGANITYLVRPDQHIAAAFTKPTREAVIKARQKALGAMLPDSVNEDMKGAA